VLIFLNSCEERRLPPCSDPNPTPTQPQPDPNPNSPAPLTTIRGLQEGWDGPALLVFSDGKKIGARLDRNGLRPARFWRTADDTIYVASEVGVLGDVLTNAGNIVAKGRLGPGQMVCADLEAGSFSENADISRDVATRRPYKQWVAASVRRLEQLCAGKYPGEPAMEGAKMLRLQVWGRGGRARPGAGRAAGVAGPVFRASWRAAGADVRSGARAGA
jgi:hypothetical protein